MIAKTSLLALLTASLSFLSTVKASSDVLDLTAADFDDTIQNNPLVLAEFFAPWVILISTMEIDGSVDIARLWRLNMRRLQRN